MARSKNQKLKLIYLMELLWKQTDEEHVVSMQQILAYMESKNIHAERKSIYDDLEVLRSIGWDIQNRREHPAGYYLKNHLFSQQDIHALVNTIKSSRLLTARKSKEMTEIIKRLCSQWEAETLDGKIYVTDRIKAMNESLSLNIEVIHKAITRNREISFRYTGWEKAEDGNLQKIVDAHYASPWAITLTDEDYYLTVYEDGRIRQYLIGQMNYIRMTARMRKGQEAWKEFDHDRR
ncbi:MAG: WYL domain-containing protein [Lachnospiraceae bacterium]|nr:WYL domain-containing protein [Lachnospiraceae bacterium]